MTARQRATSPLEPTTRSVNSVDTPRHYHGFKFVGKPRQHSVGASSEAAFIQTALTRPQTPDLRFSGVRHLVTRLHPYRKRARFCGPRSQFTELPHHRQLASAEVIEDARSMKLLHSVGAQAAPSREAIGKGRMIARGVDVDVHIGPLVLEHPNVST